MGRRWSGRWVVRDLDLELGPGEALALVGPNGVGKSTVLAMAAGDLLPSAGAVLVRGRDPALAPAVRGEVGYLSHETVLDPDEAAGAQVEFCHRMRGGGDPDPGALRQAFALDEAWDRPAGGLSRGYARRVELAAVLAGGPALVLLDEPLAGLDAPRRRELAERVRRLVPGAAVLMATHVPEELGPLGERVLRLGEGTPLEIEDAG